MWFRATCIESYECVSCRATASGVSPAVGAAAPRRPATVCRVFVARAVYWPLYLWGPAGRSYPVGGSQLRARPRGTTNAGRGPDEAGRAAARRPPRPPPARAGPARRRARAGAPVDPRIIPGARRTARGAATPRRTGRAGRGRVLAVTEFKTAQYRVLRVRLRTVGRWTRFSRSRGGSCYLLLSRGTRLEPPDGRARLVRCGYRVR